MIFDASRFVLDLPTAVSSARRVLIKPSAAHPLPYPVTTGRETLYTIVSAIRQLSEADILLLEGSADGGPMKSIYRALGYDFPRVLTVDVRDCTLVEVENPLSRPFALPSLWVPNIVLACDYLITVAPLKIIGNNGYFSIMNLLSLLPINKYRNDLLTGWDALYSLGIQRVVADLYFTLPCDLGIVDARQKFVGDSDTRGEVEPYGKIFVDDPYEVDREVSETLGVETDYLRIIESVKEEFEI